MSVELSSSHPGGWMQEPADDGIPTLQVLTVTFKTLFGMIWSIKCSTDRKFDFQEEIIPNLRTKSIKKSNVNNRIESKRTFIASVSCSFSRHIVYRIHYRLSQPEQMRYIMIGHHNYYVDIGAGSQMLSA